MIASCSCIWLTVAPFVCVQPLFGDGFFEDPRFKLLLGTQSIARGEEGVEPGPAAAAAAAGLSIDVDAIGRAEIASRAEISPLATSLGANLCFDAKASSRRPLNWSTSGRGNSDKFGFGSILERHRDQGKAESGRPAGPPTPNGLAFCGPPARSDNGRPMSLRMRAPIHIGEPERALFHRQILHKLFVAETTPPADEPERTAVKSKSRSRCR